MPSSGVMLSILLSISSKFTKNNILCGIEKFGRNVHIQKKSSPKLIAFDTSLMTATIGKLYENVICDRSLFGRIAETAVGAHLLRLSADQNFDVYWYRKNNKEVGFVLTNNDDIIAIEVKSGKKSSSGGMSEFLKNFPRADRVIVGNNASCTITLADFLKREKLLG